MKKFIERSAVIRAFLFTLLMVGTTCYLIAQEAVSPKHSPFSVVISKTDQGFKLICTQGCAWKELTFTIPEGKPQAIDEFGMRTLTKNITIEESNPSKFLFTLAVVEGGLKLKGMKGTSWQELGFTCPSNCRQTIDENGGKLPFAESNTRLPSWDNTEK
jgi:hypothetical protein